MLKKILICLLTVALLIPTASCDKESEEYAVKYGNTYVSEGMYRYMYASLKRYYLDTYNDIRDNGEAWSQKINDDYTYAEYVDEKIRETIKVFIISAELYDSYGYSINNEGRASISSVFQDAINHFGSEEKLLESLESEFGMSGEDLRKVYEIQYKYERMLFDSGVVKVDDAARDEYYNEKYILVKIIFFGTKFGYEVDEKGELVLGPGGYETYELSEEEKQAKIARADEIYFELQQGSLNFDDVYVDKETNEFETVNYPNGIYFGRDNYTDTGLVEIAETAFAMEDGELARVSDENGEFLIRRYPLPDKAYESGEDYTQFSDLDGLCEKYKFDKRMQELLPGVETNADIVEGCSVTDLAPVSY